MRILILVTIFFAFCLESGAESPKTPEEQPPDQANQTAAINPFSSLSELEKEDVKELYKEGVELARQENWIFTEKFFSSIIDNKHIKPYRNRSYLIYGYSLYAQKKYEKAAKYLEKSLKAFPALKSDIYFMIANAYYKSGNYKKSMRHFKKSWKTNIKSPYRTALMEERKTYHEAKLLEWDSMLKNRKNYRVIEETKSIEKVEKQTKIKSGFCSADLFWLRVKAYKNLNKKSSEHKVFEKALINNHHSCYFSDQIEAYENTLKESGNPLALQLTEESIDRINNLKSLFRTKDALALIEELEKKIPKKYKDDKQRALCKKLEFTKARTLFFAQRYDEALKIFQHLYKTNGEEKEKLLLYVYNIARVYAKQNKLEQSSKTYLQVAELNTNSNLAKKAEFMAGWILGFVPEKRAEADKLLEAFREKRKRGTLTIKALWYRGWFAYMDKNYKKAERHFKELAESYPWSHYKRASRYWLGRIYDKIGNKQLAKTYYVSLAGEEVFGYYRLLSLHRLDQMHQVTDDKTQTVTIDSSRFKMTDSDSDKINKLAKVHIKNWLEHLEKDDKEFKLMNFRTGMIAKNHILKTYFHKKSYKALVRVNKLANKWKPVFPCLKQAVMYHNLGLETLAADKLESFVKRIKKLKKARNYRRYKRNGNKLDERLFNERKIVLKKTYKSFYKDLLTLFVIWEDTAMYHKVFGSIMPKSERNSFPEHIGDMLWFPVAFDSEIEKFGDSHDIEDDLLMSIMRTESRYQPKVVSYAGAVGLMQIMPHTADKIANRMNFSSHSDKRLFKPEISINFGAWYLSQLVTKFNGQLPLAIASYNGGPHNVIVWLDRNQDLPWDEFVECIEFAQTRHYVKKVLKTMSAYRYIYSGSLKPWDFGKPIDYNHGNNIDF